MALFVEHRMFPLLKDVIYSNLVFYMIFYQYRSPMLCSNDLECGNQSNVTYAAC